MNEVGKNIKKCRETVGLSQQDLANRISVSRQAISNWERGVSLPDIDMVVALAKELHVDVEDILYAERPVSEFLASKAKRIKTATVLGLCFFINLFLISIPSSNYLHDITALLTVEATLYSSSYAIGTAFFFSTLSIWIDLRIQSKPIRTFMITLSSVFICLTFTFLYVSILDVHFGFNLNEILNSYSLYNWLLAHPIVFIFPGTMLFCGFNKKPSRPV